MFPAPVADRATQGQSPRWLRASAAVAITAHLSAAGWH